MSSFTAPLLLSPNVNGTKWRTCREFSYEIGMKGSGLAVTVPKDTFTDLATVPRILWPLVPPHDPGFSAAFVLHDHLCRVHDFSRVMADVILYEALRVLGAPVWKAWIAYVAVSTWRIIKRK